MANKVNVEYVKELTAQLPVSEQLKVVADICEQLRSAHMGSEAQAVWEKRLQLAEDLLTACEEVDDDSQGTRDAVGDIRRIREERIRQICQSDA